MTKQRNSHYFLKIICVASAMLIWELIARTGLFSPLIFPSLIGTFLYVYLHTELLFESVCYTLKLLITGLFLSSVACLLVGALTCVSEKLRSIVETFVSIISPIPSISILPFAILWFGLGENPIVFVTFFGSFCPFMINIMNAFATIDKIQVDVGKIYGLKTLGLVRHIMLPTSFPQILAGFRSAWGVAWRSVVAAELVFGAIGGKGGLGWLIYLNRFKLDPNGMMAALLSISFIGIVMENVVLEIVERKTVRKWGMKS